VLAIAVLGIVMVNAFGDRLNHELVRLALSPGVLQTVRSQTIKLAALPIPAGLSPATTAAIQQAIGEAFVFAFRIVMLICAGLGIASSAVSWLMIPKRPS
jgi:hypothetical protein